MTNSFPDTTSAPYTTTSRFPSSDRPSGRAFATRSGFNSIFSGFKKFKRAVTTQSSRSRWQSSHFTKPSTVSRVWSKVAGFTRDRHGSTRHSEQPDESTRPSDQSGEERVNHILELGAKLDVRLSEDSYEEGLHSSKYEIQRSRMQSDIKSGGLSFTPFVSAIAEKSLSRDRSTIDTLLERGWQRSGRMLWKSHCVPTTRSGRYSEQYPEDSSQHYVHGCHAHWILTSILEAPAVKNIVCTDDDTEVTFATRLKNQFRKTAKDLPTRRSIWFWQEDEVAPAQTGIYSMYAESKTPFTESDLRFRGVQLRHGFVPSKRPKSASSRLASMLSGSSRPQPRDTDPTPADLATTDDPTPLPRSHQSDPQLSNGFSDSHTTDACPYGYFLTTYSY